MAGWYAAATLPAPPAALPISPPSIVCSHASTGTERKVGFVKANSAMRLSLVGRVMPADPPNSQP